MVAFPTLLNLIILLFASGQACALQLTPTHHIVPRQFTGNIDPSLIPTQCTSDCQDIVTSLNGCTISGTLDKKCICTDWNMNAISECFACEEKEIGLDDGEAQTTLNDFVYACNDAGYSVHTGVVGYSHNGVSHASVQYLGVYLTVALGMIFVLA